MLINVGIPASNAAYITFDTTDDALWLDKKHTKLNAETVASIFREIANVIAGEFDEPYSGGEMSGSCGMDGIANWQIDINH